MSEDKLPVILCVDDDPINLKLLEAVLTPRGYAIELCASAEESFEKASRDLPDLILLDIIMPKVSGLEVLAKLRADERTRLIPVILLTALQDEADRIRGIEAGCDDFISKPFDKAELLARVKSLLRISFYRRQIDEKEKFEAIFRGMSDGVIVCNPEWVVTAINLSAQQYLNIKAMESLRLADFIFSNYEVSITREEFSNLEVVHKSFEIVRSQTGQFKALNFAAGLDILKDNLGNVTSIVLSLRDVSEAHREESLKNDFLGFISHKLDTPLGVIYEGLSVLREGLADPLTVKQQKVVDSISSQLNLFKNLIAKLIKFTQITGAELVLPKQTIELFTYFSGIASSAAVLEKNKKIEWLIDCPDKDSRINANKEYFDLIIIQLIENAQKFNDQDIIRIGIKVKNLPDHVEIRISDNGRGIPEEERENVFRKFYQIEKYFTGRVEGAGLGLALVKQLLLNLKGAVSLESEIGKGTTFILTLPK